MDEQREVDSAAGLFYSSDIYCFWLNPNWPKLLLLWRSKKNPKHLITCSSLQAGFKIIKIIAVILSMKILPSFLPRGYNTSPLFSAQTELFTISPHSFGHCLFNRNVKCKQTSVKRGSGGVLGHIFFPPSVWL